MFDQAVLLFCRGYPEFDQGFIYSRSQVLFELFRHHFPLGLSYLLAL
jgi:hypothetical protein